MRGLFFNAQPTTDITNHPSGFDREYDSDDFNRYMGVFFSNGVFVRDSPDACKVTASGLRLDVTPGVVLLDGGQCHFEPGDGLSITQGDGLYSVMCRRNNAAAVRAFELVAVRGEEEYPAPVREGDLYDLCLAHVQVEDGVSTVTDTRSNEELCGMALIVAPKSQDTVTRFPWMHDAYDFNDLLADGEHEHQGIAQNSPYGSGTDQHFWVHVYRHNDHYLRQVAYDVRGSSTFERSRIGGSWTPWREILTDGSVQTGWALLWSVGLAGSGTWTAPDLNNGKPYRIGVLLISGGGGGSAVIGTSGGYAMGGATGKLKVLYLVVTPGQQVPYVVGAGGAGGVRSTNGGPTNGVAGGATSFAGQATPGGPGGWDGAWYNAISGFVQNLGQPSAVPILYSGVVPFGGTTVEIARTGGSNDNPICFSDALSCYNPFTSQKMLSAGGSAWGSGVTNAGPGGGAARTNSAGPVKGDDATVLGCGGGAASINGSSGTATGGNGYNGGILIYVERYST